jgi:cystathionine beta-lyase/cystathionine gamma-synthase
MVYSRGNNPTLAAVETKIARLERGDACRCLASGMAAVSAVLLSRLRSGDHVLFVNQIYGPTLQLARRLERFGIAHDVVLDLEVTAVERALRPETRLLWMESPGTMLFRQLDVATVAELARHRGVATVVDNSWATPLFQKPLTHGVDLVVHSATKYLGGHSDLVAGAVVGGAEAMERLFYDALLLHGGVLGSHDAWLLNRGLRTLPVRLRRHHDDALELARRLATHRRVARVFHPGVVGGQLAEALGGFSGLFSFELEDGAYSAVARCVDRLRRFRIGVSWGGVESLVLTPNRGDNAEALARAGSPAGLVRLSVGLEGVEPLWADLERALAP